MQQKLIINRLYSVVCHLAPVNCLRLSTTVEDSLQISSFLCKTNPILSAVGGLQMNLSILSKQAYENFIRLAEQKNKPNSNPISKKAKMNANIFITKDYENDTALRPEKTNPNKPNFKSDGGNEIMERFTQPIRPILKNYEKEP
jgi:hypothetical protein